MRLPRFRIWLLMLAVAFAALGSAAWVFAARSQRFTQEAEYHRMLSESSYFASFVNDHGDEVLLTERERRRHRRAAERYERAARYPWLGAPRIEPSLK